MESPTEFAGERIRVARTIFGLTQAQLADATGVTQAQISSVENGTRSTNIELLRAIGNATGTPLSFFYVVPSELPLGSLRFRKLAGASRTSTKRAEALFGESYRVVAELCRMGRYPTPDLPRAFDDPSSEDIESFATQTREALKIGPDGPIPHLIRACERAGIPVAPMVLPGEASEDTPTDVGHFGVSFWAGPGEHALVGYFPGSRADRDRFTIAHELGHLVLHTHRPRTRMAEQEANRFASALLIPQIRAEQALSDKLKLADYARLKAIWGVSIQALIMRADQLDLITSSRKESLFKQLSARGWRKNEPVTVHPEHPLLLWKLLDTAFGNTPAQVLGDKLALPVVLLRSLAPRPSDTIRLPDGDGQGTVLSFRRNKRNSFDTGGEVQSQG